MENKKYVRTKRETISILLKIIVIVAAVIGVLLTILAPDDEFMGGKALLYFTIQSNIWIMVACAYGLVRMLKGREAVRWEMLAKLVFTVSIALTGTVFAVMLAPTLGAKAWVPYSICCHALVPALSVADFILTGGETKYRKGDIWFVLLPPLYYVFFASAGYLLNWNFGGGRNYPYFFLNWGNRLGAFGVSGQMPYFGTIWWIVILMIFLLFCGWLLVKIAAYVNKQVVK